MAMVEETSIWEEIERAESYLVCCLFDDATSLASSILKRLLQNHNRSSKVLWNYENEWDDMVESAAMVLVQSLKQSQRSLEILKELKLLFGSLNLIPVQVFLAGACLQMSESPSTSVQNFVEEFLNSWRYVDGQYCPLPDANDGISDTEGSCFGLSIGVDHYLEVVELYVITFLATTIKDTDCAISWVEKATLPMEKRQDLLRRLDSMKSSTATTSSRTCISAQLPNEYKSDILQDNGSYNGNQKDIESKSLQHGGKTTKEEILKLSRQRVPFFWWFPTISFKLGNTRFVVPNGKMLIVSLLLLMYYLTRRKQAVVKMAITKKALSMKKALMDLWQLAFSYQVNPLAAVQTLPTATRGSY